jgi:thiosulfate/3-mercaptopyruvate sulfurtransferase
LEAWEKVFIEDSFLATYHARFGCIACHGGTGGTDDMGLAHAGMVRDPHPTNSETCQLCHAGISEVHVDSLHYDLEGYISVLSARSDEAHWDQLMVAYENHCTECHASCGQCHISRPTVNDGGLLDGHNPKRRPPMNNTCTGCHGSRVNDEYKGKNEMAEGGRYPADVHYNPGGMACFECHDGDSLHGTDGDYDHRYDGPESPSCSAAGCHDDVSPEGDIEQHDEVHLAKLSCQACHSVAYKHCYNCHVQQTEDGRAYYRVEPSQMAFKIGRNPIQSPDRPWEYVPLRHVPIARDSFAYYGENLLPNFDSLPTWAYATPHSIQRVTAQNATCDACHGNSDVFLTEDDVLPDELEANEDVIVREVPPLP